MMSKQRQGAFASSVVIDTQSDAGAFAIEAPVERKQRTRRIQHPNSLRRRCARWTKAGIKRACQVALAVLVALAFAAVVLAGVAAVAGDHALLDNGHMVDRTLGGLPRNNLPIGTTVTVLMDAEAPTGVGRLVRPVLANTAQAIVVSATGDALGSGRYQVQCASGACVEGERFTVSLGQIVGGPDKGTSITDWLGQLWGSDAV